MLPTTFQIVKSGLQGDPTLTPRERARLLALLQSGASAQKPLTPAPDQIRRLIRRAEVARRLSCSLRTVDKLPIKKFKLPGRVRAAGFREADVNALLA